MEAAGSRQSRAASRYAASPSPPVFTGPVRKWKKQWVSYSSTNTNSNSNSNGGKRNEAPPLLLCRWTPLSSSAAADEPPARRFRYTPIVPIEKGKTNGEDDEGGAASFINQSNNEWDGMVRKPSTGDFSKEEEEEEAQELSEDQSRF